MNEFDKNSSDSQDPMPDEVAASLEQVIEGDASTLKDVWNIVGIARPDEPDTLHIQEAKGRLIRSMRRQGRGRQDRNRMHPQRRNKVSRWKIASVLTLLGVCLIWFGNRTVEFAAPNGIAKTITLSDGSTVVLQAGSRLVKESWMWGSSRDVMLTGEAFFEVVPGNKPFTVHTRNADVTVLGTSFNVAVWPKGNNEQTVLHVKSGTVLFSPDDVASRGDTVYAGQMSRLIGEQNTVSDPAVFNPDIALMWLEGGIAFSDQPLAEVIAALARRLDVKIEIDPSANDDELITWIQPKLGKVEHALTDICNVATCSFQRIGDVYYVK